MGKQRAKHPFEDDFFIDGFLGWMDPHEGQHSIEALDMVFDALEHAGVDAKRRKIVWDHWNQPRHCMPAKLPIPSRYEVSSRCGFVVMPQ